MVWPHKTLFQLYIQYIPWSRKYSILTWKSWRNESTIWMRTSIHWYIDSSSLAVDLTMWVCHHQTYIYIYIYIYIYKRRPCPVSIVCFYLFRNTFHICVCFFVFIIWYTSLRKKHHTSAYTRRDTGVTRLHIYIYIQSIIHCLHKFGNLVGPL